MTLMEHSSTVYDGVLPTMLTASICIGLQDFKGAIRLRADLRLRLGRHVILRLYFGESHLGPTTSARSTPT